MHIKCVGARSLYDQIDQVRFPLKLSTLAMYNLTRSLLIILLKQQTIKLMMKLSREEYNFMFVTIQKKLHVFKYTQKKNRNNKPDHIDREHSKMLFVVVKVF